jgi:hypothetical protein
MAPKIAPPEAVRISDVRLRYTRADVKPAANTMGNKMIGGAKLPMIELARKDKAATARVIRTALPLLNPTRDGTVGCAGAGTAAAAGGGASTAFMRAISSSY